MLAPRPLVRQRSQRLDGRQLLAVVRERDLDARPLTDLVARCVEAVGATRTRVLVNDRLDVALAAGADGVAVISALSLAPDPGAAARELRRVVDEGLAKRVRA